MATTTPRILKASLYEDCVPINYDRERSYHGIPCPESPEHMAAAWREGRLDVFWERRGPIPQVMWTNMYELIVSQELHSALVKKGISGYVTKGATVRQGDRIREDDYLHMLVQGWGGFANPESGIELLERCPTCNRNRWSSPTHPEKVADPSQWDGSDLYWIWPQPTIFVSKNCEEVMTSVGLGDWIGAFSIPDWEIGMGYTMGPIDSRISRDRALEVAPDWASKVHWPGWDRPDECFA